MPVAQPRRRHFLSIYTIMYCVCSPSPRFGSVQPLTTHVPANVSAYSMPSTGMIFGPLHCAPIVFVFSLRTTQLSICLCCLYDTLSVANASPGTSLSSTPSHRLCPGVWFCPRFDCAHPLRGQRFSDVSTSGCSHLKLFAGTATDFVIVSGAQPLDLLLKETSRDSSGV